MNNPITPFSRKCIVLLVLIPTITVVYSGRCAAEEYGKAFDAIRSVCSLPDSDIDNLEKHAVAQLSSLRGKLGDCAGYDVADIATQGSTLIRATCIAKHTNIPLRWTFVFYKPEDKWILVKFKYDDKALDGEFRAIR